MRELYHKLKSEFKSYQTLLFVCFIFFMGAGFAFVATRNTDKSSAISTDGFNPGNIISDAVMANYNSMTVEEIQKFLTDKNPCNNRNYNLYKEQSTLYPKISWHWDGDEKSGHFVCISEEKFGEGTEIGEGETAAEIIYAAAQEYKINPQVLIVLLEKEQGLISDTYPHSNQYRSATGYGCPDTAACDSKYYGFKNQVFRAAELFRYTLDNGSYLYPDNKKGVYVAYNPSSSCGGTEVFIENRATSALYRYTPYQPNSAALAAGFGLGDTCSAYGNRNFYLYFTKWFGSTQAKVDGEVTDLIEGEYTIVSRLNSSRTLGLTSVSNNVQLTALNDEDNYQRWKISKANTTGYYTLTNVATNYVLDIQDALTNSGTNIQAWRANNGCAQQWKPYRTSDDYVVFESACMPGMVVDVSGAATHVGNNIHLWIANGGNVQKWSLRPGNTILDGVYTISAQQDDTKRLAIANDSTKNGANVIVSNANKQLSQKWIFKYNKTTGLYNIFNSASGRYLDLDSAKTTIGNNIQIYQYAGNGCAQSWKVIKNLDDSYTILTACANNRTLGFADPQPDDNTNVNLGPISDSKKWNIIPISQIERAVYEIYPEQSAKKALDVADAGRKNGTNVQLFDTNKDVAQEWEIIHEEKGYYTVINPNSGKALDIADAKMQKNTNIQLFTPNNDCAQRWYIVDNNDGYTFLAACSPNVALDLSNASINNGTNIQLYETNNTNAQRWTIHLKFPVDKESSESNIEQ